MYLFVRKNTKKQLIVDVAMYYYTNNSITATSNILVNYNNLINKPTTSSQWTTLGANIYYSSGNVGIQNISPIASLNIGDSSVVGSDGSIIIAKCSAVGTSMHYKIGIDSTYDFIIGDSWMKLVIVLQRLVHFLRSN